MMSRRRTNAAAVHGNAHLQAQLAHAAARVMAEDGVSDYGHAKRKALRRLGLPDSHPLPSNSEVESALKSYLALYQADEQPARLREMRAEAVRLMQFLAPYRPYLIGSVLDGTAGRSSSIDIQLYADSAKDVEIFLLDHAIAYRHGQPRHGRAEAVFIVDTDSGCANLIVYPLADERIVYRNREGRARERARVDAVQTLLAAA
jgi:hypothetical protein